MVTANLHLRYQPAAGTAGQACHGHHCTHRAQVGRKQVGHSQHVRQQHAKSGTECSRAVCAVRVSGWQAQHLVPYKGPPLNNASHVTLVGLTVLQVALFRHTVSDISSSAVMHDALQRLTAPGGAV
jgi:hypothetical protein